MATFLRRSSKLSWLYTHSNRTYFTGSRYSGYVNFFHNENLFGFVVREDAPEREYYFHVTDLHAENIPRVRPLQPVEFSIIEGRGGNFMARDISAVGGQPLRYSHANMKMKDEERNRNLSELPNSEIERHTGVVVSIMPSGKGGLIVPDRLNFGTLGYSTNDIQATGAQRLDRFSEVEFFARPSKYDRKDRAVCLTRRGGGLITAERRNTGHSRRLLGAMYGPNDITAVIPADFQENRRRGYVINYSRDKLFGFIVPTDEPSANGFFVHIDDVHIYGSRFLKRYQEVEFSVVTDAHSGKSKALHVSGPNKTVLRSISENRYLPTNLTNNKLPIDENKRYLGSIMVASPKVNWFIIKPDEKGFEPVMGYKNNVNALGSRRLHLDDVLEFNVSEPSENYESGLLRATNISAPNGYPILCETGPLAKYLQTKIHLNTYQTELDEYDIDNISDDTILNGYIANFNSNTKIGRIEIESSDKDVRYRRCLFKLDDIVLPDLNLDLDKLFIRDCAKIQFKLKSIDYNNEYQDVNKRRIYPKKSPIVTNDDGEIVKEEGEEEEEEEEEAGEEEIKYEDVEPIIHIKAWDIVSDGLDFLDVSEREQATQFISRLDDNNNNKDDDDDDLIDNQPIQRRQSIQTQQQQSLNKNKKEQKSIFDDDDDDNVDDEESLFDRDDKDEEEELNKL